MKLPFKEFIAKCAKDAGVVNDSNLEIFAEAIASEAYAEGRKDEAEATQRHIDSTISSLTQLTN